MSLTGTNSWNSNASDHNNIKATLQTSEEKTHPTLNSDPTLNAPPPPPTASSTQCLDSTHSREASRQAVPNSRPKAAYELMKHAPVSKEVLWKLVFTLNRQLLSVKSRSLHTIQSMRKREASMRLIIQQKEKELLYYQTKNGIAPKQHTLKALRRRRRTRSSALRKSQHTTSVI